MWGGAAAAAASWERDGVGLLLGTGEAPGEEPRGEVEGEAAGDPLAAAEGAAAGDGLAPAAAAALAGRQMSVSWPYFANTASLMTAGWLAPSLRAASCGPILTASGTWQVMQRSTWKLPLTCTLGKSCWMSPTLKSAP